MKIMHIIFAFVWAVVLFSVSVKMFVIYSQSLGYWYRIGSAACGCLGLIIIICISIDIQKRIYK